MTTHSDAINKGDSLHRLSASSFAPDHKETHHRDELLRRFADRIAVNPDLSRSLVSWQSNRNTAGFRWFKFKEGFSVELARYLLGHLDGPGRLLDPFAGTNVAPITAAEAGWEGVGIEILPVAVKVAKALLAAPATELTTFRLRSTQLLGCVLGADSSCDLPPDSFPHVRITEHAFPADSEPAIALARNWLRQARRERKPICWISRRCPLWRMPVGPVKMASTSGGTTVREDDLKPGWKRGAYCHTPTLSAINWTLLQLIYQ